MPTKTADAVVEANAQARIDGLRAALSVVTLLALVALVFRAHTDSATRLTFGVELTVGVVGRPRPGLSNFVD